MPKVVKRTFSLTEELAKFIDARVEQGGYASGSEVVREGLRGLQEDEALIERWIREEVLPTAHDLDAHPEHAIPLEEAFDQLLAEVAEPQPKRKRA